MAIEPNTKADRDKMSTALQRLAEEDPTFRLTTDQETGQTIISGMGELHLDIIKDRMFREFNVGATAGKPQVAYRETITKPLRPKANLSVNQVVAVNMATRSLPLSPVKRAVVL